MRLLFRLALLVLAACISSAAEYTCYVGGLGPNHVLLAWGTTAGGARNTIGRASASHGKATATAGNQSTVTEKNWAVLTGLAPDREFPWRVELGGQTICAGKVRTWPVKAEKLAFFVMGDYGNGSQEQFRLAGVMRSELERRRESANPVRFVLTTGDNIYGTALFNFHSGAADADWAARFYQPYKGVTGSVPFFATLGNHDGNETERRADLTVYLDNFFFPRNEPARYYHFRFADLAEFFALDTTSNTLEGAPRSNIEPGGEQHLWLEKTLKAATVRWKIPYYHHAPFSAGPRHEPSGPKLEHILGLFRASGVRVAFNGHEHNFQFSEASEATGGIRYITTGAGGALRTGDVRRNMAREHIDGWAPQRHFTVVEIEGATLRVTPVSYEPVKVTGRDGGEIGMPLEIRLTDGNRGSGRPAGAAPSKAGKPSRP